MWEQLQAQVFLGPQAFLAEMQTRLADEAPLREVPRVQRRPLKQALSEWQSSSARWAMALPVSQQPVSTARNLCIWIYLLHGARNDSWRLVERSRIQRNLKLPEI